MKDKVTKMAHDFFNIVLASSGKDDAPFYMLVDVNLDGEIKPLLILWHAHPSRQDGSVLAVLNPDRMLVSELSAVCGYGVDILKEIVCKRCDLMVCFWVESYLKNPDPRVSSYQARRPAKAKFYAKDGLALK